MSLTKFFTTVAASLMTVACSTEPTGTVYSVAGPAEIRSWQAIPAAPENTPNNTAPLSPRRIIPPRPLD